MTARRSINAKTEGGGTYGSGTANTQFYAVHHLFGHSLYGSGARKYPVLRSSAFVGPLFLWGLNDNQKKYCLCETISSANFSRKNGRRWFFRFWCAQIPSFPLSAFCWATLFMGLHMTPRNIVPLSTHAAPICHAKTAGRGIYGSRTHK